MKPKLLCRCKKRKDLRNIKDSVYMVFDPERVHEEVTMYERLFLLPVIIIMEYGTIHLRNRYFLGEGGVSPLLMFANLREVGVHSCWSKYFNYFQLF